MRYLILVIALLSCSSAVEARNQPKGYISNVDGDQCWFTQETSRETHFHSASAETARLVFDDPTCMKATGLELEINIMMINNFIAPPYTQTNAAFLTRYNELRATSIIQVRGSCIQSQNFPMIGVVVEYFGDNDGHIVSVAHASAVQGCN